MEVEGKERVEEREEEEGVEGVEVEGVEGRSFARIFEMLSRSALMICRGERR